MSNKKARYLTGHNNSNVLSRLVTAVFNFFFDQSKPNFAINKKMGCFKDCRAHSDDGANYGANINYRHIILLCKVVCFGSVGIRTLGWAASYNLKNGIKHAWQSSFQGCYVWARLRSSVSVGPISFPLSSVGRDLGQSEAKLLTLTSCVPVAA